MTNDCEARGSIASGPPPLVYLARRLADRTVTATRLAGLEGDGQPFQAINRQVQLTGHTLIRHWAFGGSDDHDQDGPVFVPDLRTTGSVQAFRVSVQHHESEAASAIIVIQGESQAPPRTGAPVAACTMCQVQDAMKGLWSLAGCCRYLYEVNAKDELRVHLMEGPFQKIFGVGRDEMRAPTFALFLRNILPEDRPFPEAVGEILAANGSWSGAYRVRGEDGYVRHMRHFAVRHEYQGSVFVSGLILDESASAAAREESSVFRLSVENSREGFAITDSKGRYTYLNQEHARLFGYPDAGELLGHEWKMLYRPPEVEIIQQKISQEVEKAGFWHGQVLALRKDGTTFKQDLTLSLMASRGLVCVCRDRTEELQINARLEESETMLRTLFDALPMGILIRDEHGVRQFANGFILRGDGSGAAELPSSDWALGGKEWERRQVETDRQVLSTGKSCEYVIESEVAKQKRWFHCIVFLVPASSGGGRRIGSLVMDITRQKRLEQEATNLSERRREFLEMQREFISMVSHEFRTPLTTIQGAQYLLEKLFKQSPGLSRTVTENAEKWLGLQASALATLRKLVDQVLMLNRIAHMTGEASLERLSPADVLAETVARFNDSMDTARVVLRTDLPTGFKASMDPGLVKAAAENLISNGLKYSALGSAVQVRVYAEPNGWAVDVVDEGRGIPQADQAKLFRPFFRAGNVGTVPGTGLGLAIVRRAVDFHGGRIRFESEEDEGTKFELHFPNVARPPADETVLGRVPPIGEEQSHE